MNTTLIASALGLSVAAGVSPYATVALLGLAHQVGWVAHLPAELSGITNPWVITLAVTLTLIEFAATLIPGIASAWEVVHAAIRPPLAAILAALVVWDADPALIAATALAGGTIAFGTSLTKLGARLAIDTSPEPVSNGAANVAELTLVGLIAVFVWRHPVLASAIAVAIVVTTAIVVRALWGMIWKAVTRARRPGVGQIRS
ncbi:MAG TPA: DUF4126 domain-containing protein [Gemmatimonadaceae bacterium]|nr:DUF4126 domain-containing protein [Gemmatimonadaceae bacterium]